MTDGTLFAIGGGVTFLFLAGAYVVFRNRFVELYGAGNAIGREPLEERNRLHAVPEQRSNRG